MTPTHKSEPNAERHEALRRERYEVRGVVQGVGFRPFVYRLALEEGLAGFIGNDTGGVTIEIEGPAERVEAFRRRLESEAPPLARIDSVLVRGICPKQEKEFRIVASDAAGQVSTGIPADAATCADCLHELFDPEDRRYRYPFLNCTNCGPRYTITRSIPYDRPQTSMAKFKMCAACQAEYDDPANRRYHAQPNACALCGPRVWLVGSDGAEIPSDNPVQATIDRLMAGEIMAIKGIGGFHLAVDATNKAAVMRLRERKHRYGKPLAVMVRDIEAARGAVRTQRRRGSVAPEGGAVHCARAAVRGLWHCRFCCAGDSVAGRVSALRALAASALCRRARTCAGDDQRQPERGADCNRQ